MRKLYEERKGEERLIVATIISIIVLQIFLNLIAS